MPTKKVWGTTALDNDKLKEARTNMEISTQLESHKVLSSEHDASAVHQL